MELNDQLPQDEGQKGMNPLSIPHIVRNVVGYLPFTDVLSASLVNKTWKTEARWIMENKRFCVLKCYDRKEWNGKDACLLLQKANDDIFKKGGLGVGMFKGIKIGRCWHNEIDWVHGLGGTCERMLKGLRLKYLDINGRRKAPYFSEVPIYDCEVNRFAARLFLSNLATLEELHVDPTPNFLAREVKKLKSTVPVYLPELTSIYMYGVGINWWNMREDFFVKLLKSPKLERIGGTLSQRPMSVVREALPRKYLHLVDRSRIRELSLRGKGGRLDDSCDPRDIVALARAKPRLKLLNLGDLSDVFLPESVKNAIGGIFKSSCGRLENVSMSLCLLKHLRYSFWCSMKKVRHVELIIHPELGYGESGADVYSASSLALFPHMTTLSFAWKEEASFDEQKKEMIIRSEFIKKIRKKIEELKEQIWEVTDAEVVEELSEEIKEVEDEFEKIAAEVPGKVTAASGCGCYHKLEDKIGKHEPKKLLQLEKIQCNQPILSVRGFDELGKWAPECKIVEAAFSNWGIATDWFRAPVFERLPLLEVIEVAVPWSSGPHLDSTLLGINQEEFITLQDKDKEFLSVLQIVPIRPCLTTLKNLRSLRFKFSMSGGDKPDYRVAKRRVSPFFLTKVVALLAFRRMPQVEIIIEEFKISGKHKDKNGYKFAKELKPYMRML